MYLLRFINLSFFMFSDQEKLVTNMGSDNQEARKEIISLKEQLASTSQVIISNPQGKRKLIWRIGQFEKLSVKLQCSTDGEKRLLFRVIHREVRKIKSRVRENGFHLTRPQSTAHIFIQRAAWGEVGAQVEMRVTSHLTCAPTSPHAARPIKFYVVMDAIIFASC